MTLTTEQQREEDATSERVAFQCGGCGRDTVIHVGKETYLTDKRCLQCRGTSRFGRALPQVKGRIGTHEGRIKTAERRETKAAASARNRQRKAGLKAKNGTTYRNSCASYGCTHRKHSVASGGGKKY